MHFAFAGFVATFLNMAFTWFDWNALALDSATIPKFSCAWRVGSSAKMSAIRASLASDFHGGIDERICVQPSSFFAALQAGHTRPACTTLNMDRGGSVL